MAERVLFEYLLIIPQLFKQWQSRFHLKNKGSRRLDMAPRAPKEAKKKEQTTNIGYETN